MKDLEQQLLDNMARGVEGAREVLRDYYEERGLREYAFAPVTVPSGIVATVGLVPRMTPVEGTGIPGFPETQCVEGLTVEKPFRPTHIVVPDDCADAFVVTMCLIGQKIQWRVKGDSLSPRILNARPAIKFDVVWPQISMYLSVQNVSEGRSTFRASLVGYDLSEQEIAEEQAMQQEFYKLLESRRGE